MTTQIYTLSCPTTHEIRYVGKTAVDLNKRYAQHIYQWKRSKKLTHLNSWIMSLSKSNLKPTITLLDSVNGEWEWLEKYWISQLKTWGFNLTNLTEGGSGATGYKFSEESKLKRLVSLKSSDLWKERNIRHSCIMKDLHYAGIIKLGYGHLSEYKRKLIGERHSACMKEKVKNNKSLIQAMRIKRIVPVYNIDINGKILHRFVSVTNAGKYFNIDPTHITKVCKGKSNSTHGLYFKYK